MYKPTKGSQWTVIPQGMKNSLIIYQLYVSQALVNVPNDVFLINYIENFLLEHSDTVYLQRATKNVLIDLISLPLMVVPDKVQMVPYFALKFFLLPLFL